MAVDTAQNWVDEFRRASDEDEELQAHGKYYSCNFLLDMEEHLRPMRAFTLALASDTVSICRSRDSPSRRRSKTYIIKPFTTSRRHR